MHDDVLYLHETLHYGMAERSSRSASRYRTGPMPATRNALSGPVLNPAQPTAAWINPAIPASATEQS